MVGVCDEISIDPEQEELLKQVIFELANPEINEGITSALARDLRTRLDASEG